MDYEGLNSNLNREKYFKLADVKHRLQKVSFDICKFKDTNNESIEGLWQIKTNAEGEYIVAMYAEATPEPTVEKNASWTAIQDKSGNNINLFYKGASITNLSLSSLGLPKDEGYLVCDYLPKKLASNPVMVKALLNDLPVEDKRNLLNEYPELGL